MKILFIENRYKTGLWEEIAKEYIKDGHEIYWIVQNPMFKPSFGEVTVLPFPKKINFKKKYTPEIQKIIDGNRGLNYFGVKTDDFIFWYEREIEKALDKINPNLVFGEPTLFHELLVINSCKRKKILYLHPSGTRYPNNRFSFYLYDTLEPFKGSSEKLDASAALEIVHSIASRAISLNYMKILRYKLTKTDWLKDKLRLTFGYYLGEKYNTPSPLYKKKINDYYSKNIVQWETLASDIRMIGDEFNILYAMQMQPEANLDVWGHPNNNQTFVLQRILNELSDGEKLIVKPNPKSKYEISDELLELIKNNPYKIIALHHTSKMTDIWPLINVVVTVTGTISMECIFDNKPVIMLGPGLQNDQKNCHVLKKGEKYRPIFDEIKVNRFPKLTDHEKVDYLQTIIASSFEGTNGDGLHNVHYLRDVENFSNLKKAYKSILNEI